MKTNKLIIMAAISLTGLLILSSCGKKAIPESTSSSTPTIETTTSSQERESSNQILNALTLSVPEAIEIYQKDKPETDITSIKLISSSNDCFYKIEGVNDTTEFELTINGLTKEVMGGGTETLDNDETNGVKRKKDKLDLTNLASLASITQTAEAACDSGEASQWELKKELEITYWEVTVKDQQQEVEVKVEAQTQKVLEVEVDD